MNAQGLIDWGRSIDMVLYLCPYPLWGGWRLFKVEQTDLVEWNTAAVEWRLLFAGAIYDLQMALFGIMVYGLLTAWAAGKGDQETRCRKCQYILKGITEPRCPECGERI